MINRCYYIKNIDIEKSSIIIKLFIYTYKTAILAEKFKIIKF